MQENQPHVYTYPLPFGFPSHPRHHRALSTVPRAIQQALTSYLFHTQWRIYVHSNLPIHPTPLSPHPRCPHVCSLHLCLYFCFANRFICTIINARYACFCLMTLPSLETWVLFLACCEGGRSGPQFPHLQKWGSSTLTLKNALNPAHFLVPLTQSRALSFGVYWPLTKLTLVYFHWRKLEICRKEQKMKVIRNQQSPIAYLLYMFWHSLFRYQALHEVLTFQSHLNSHSSASGWALLS